MCPATYSSGMASEQSDKTNRSAYDRIAALSMGGMRLRYDYPVDADPEVVWQVPVGTINLRTRINPEVDEINSVRNELASGAALEEEVWVDKLVQCPACANGAELSVRGRWSDVAVLLCPCGHEWTPVPEHPQWGRRLMQAAIGGTIEGNGLPEAALLSRTR